MGKVPRVLLLSTGDATRSLMAEGFLKALTGEQFQTLSVGIKSGELHPLAIETMSEVGIDISEQRPKSVADSLREHFSHAIIVYDANKERSPVFPFAPKVYRWSIADPVTAEGTAVEAKEMFQRARNEISGYVAEFLEETGIRQGQALAIAA
jgi:protein-tyrosine-phosphatase